MSVNMLKRSTKDRVSNAVAAGTTDVKSSGVDMSAHRNVVFDIAFGAIVTGAVLKVKLQHSDTDVDGNYVDCAGTEITVADDQDNKVVSYEVVRPQKLFVRLYVTRTTQNTTIDSIIATRFSPRKVPTTHGTTVSSATIKVEPVTGTA